MKKSALTFFLLSAVAILAETAAGDVARKDPAPQQLGSGKSVVDPASGLSGVDFFEDFDSYTAGVQLVVQNPVDWECWSGGSGTTEDPFVSSAQSFSGSNAVVIAQNNDLVKQFGILTTGKWRLSWQMYIPIGKSGYFNTLALFAGATSNWAMQVFFNSGGDATLDAGAQSAATFTYTQGEWIPCEVIVDLDSDLGTFSVDGVEIYSWQWTLGAFGDGSPLQVDANDFYGFAATDEMYVDDYDVGPEGILCSEITSMAARCVGGGTKTVQVRVNLLNSTIHAGETVTITIDEDTYVGTIITNGTHSRANFSISGVYTTGDHVVSLVDPPGCLSDKHATCAIAKADPYWDDDAEWAVAGQEAPQETKLLGNYPNPFNPSTNIQYELSQDAFVTLRVYNMLGQLVATLVDEPQTTGFKSVVWDGKNESGASVASGIYVYRITVGAFTATKRMLFVK